MMPELVKLIGGFPEKRGGGFHGCMYKVLVQDGLHENSLSRSSKARDQKASSVGQIVEDSAYADSIRKVLLTNLCAKSLAAVEGIFKYMVDVKGWLGVMMTG